MTTSFPQMKRRLVSRGANNIDMKNGWNLHSTHYASLSLSVYLFSKLVNQNFMLLKLLINIQNFSNKSF